MLTARKGKEKKIKKYRRVKCLKKNFLKVKRKFFQYDIKYVLKIELKDRLYKKKYKTRRIGLKHSKCVLSVLEQEWWEVYFQS